MYLGRFEDTPAPAPQLPAPVDPAIVEAVKRAKAAGPGVIRKMPRWQVVSLGLDLAYEWWLSDAVMKGRILMGKRIGS